jgi:hypothetical protein
MAIVERSYERALHSSVRSLTIGVVEVPAGRL